MTSTRNSNMTAEYTCKQIHHFKEHSEIMYPGKRKNNLIAIPCAGINAGQYVPNTQLARNAVDVESFLYGIGSSNLVKPQKPIKAEMKCLPSLSFFNRLQPYLPQSLIVEKCQRPKIFRR